MQSDNPFNNLFREFPGLDAQQGGPKKSAEQTPGAERSGSPPNTSAATPIEPPNALALVEQMNNLRAEFKALHGDIVKEVRALRRENTRLTEENARWKALAKEYKQILSRG